MEKLKKKSEKHKKKIKDKKRKKDREKLKKKKKLEKIEQKEKDLNDTPEIEIKKKKRQLLIKIIKDKLKPAKIKRKERRTSLIDRAKKESLDQELQTGVIDQKEIKQKRKKLPNILEVYKKKKELRELPLTISFYSENDLKIDFRLNTEIVETKPKTRKKLNELNLIIKPIPTVEVKNKLDNFYSQDLLNLILEQPKNEIIREKILNNESNKIIKKGELAEIELGGGGTDKETEFFDLFRKIFGKSFNEFCEHNNVKIVLYKELESDNTIESFETFCMKFYREIHGGRPPLKLILKESDYNIDELENWISGEENITIIDLDQKKLREVLFKDLEQEQSGDTSSKDLSEIRQLLYRTINKKLGFIIFKTKDSRIYWKLFNFLNPKELTSHKLEIIEIEAKKLSEIEKKLISEIFWGNIRIPEPNFKITTFDNIFNGLYKNLYEEYLKNLKSEQGGLYSYATNPHKPKKSKEHKLLKVFILKMLVKQKKIPLNLIEIQKNIHTEQLLGGVTPDISINDKIVYEVETFFGVNAREKLKYTIEKYEKVDSVKEINIVLENFTMIRHLKELSEFKKNYKSWEQKYGKTIHFYTLDFQKESLMSLRECKNKIIELIKEHSNNHSIN